jgi:hypothetical protein
MTMNSYDIAALLARSEQWRAEAAGAMSPSVRAFCLSEAARVERMVNRSIAVPVIVGVGEIVQTITGTILGWGSGNPAGFASARPNDGGAHQAAVAAEQEGRLVSVAL